MQVIKVNDYEYIVKTSNNHASHCDIRSTVVTLLGLGVSYSEIQLGLSELIKNDHDVAEYGIGLTAGGPKFIYSMKQKVA